MADKAALEAAVACAHLQAGQQADAIHSLNTAAAADKAALEAAVAHAHLQAVQQADAIQSLTTAAAADKAALEAAVAHAHLQSVQQAYAIHSLNTAAADAEARHSTAIMQLTERLEEAEHLHSFRQLRARCHSLDQDVLELRTRLAQVQAHTKAEQSKPQSDVACAQMPLRMDATSSPIMEEEVRQGMHSLGYSSPCCMCALVR